MYDALRKLMKEDLMQAENAGIQKGFLKGKIEDRLELISNSMDSLNISADQAMDILKIPAADREFFRAKLQ